MNKMKYLLLSLMIIGSSAKTSHFNLTDKNLIIPLSLGMAVAIYCYWAGEEKKSVEAEQEFASVGMWLVAHPEALDTPSEVLEQIQAVAADTTEKVEVTWALLQQLVGWGGSSAPATPKQAAAIWSALRRQDLQTADMVFIRAAQEAPHIARALLTGLHKKDPAISNLSEDHPKIVGLVLAAMDSLTVSTFLECQSTRIAVKILTSINRSTAAVLLALLAKPNPCIAGKLLEAMDSTVATELLVNLVSTDITTAIKMMHHLCRSHSRAVANVLDSIDRTTAGVLFTTVAKEKSFYYAGHVFRSLIWTNYEKARDVLNGMDHLTVGILLSALMKIEHGEFYIVHLLEIMDPSMTAQLLISLWSIEPDVVVAMLAWLGSNNPNRTATVLAGIDRPTASAMLNALAKARSKTARQVLSFMDPSMAIEILELVP